MTFLQGLAVFATLFAQQPATWREWSEKGATLGAARQYAEAAEAFQKAVDLAPAEVDPHLGLGIALTRQFLTRTQGAEGLQYAARAEREFLRILELDPGHKPAMRSVAELKLMLANRQKDPAEKTRLLREAQGWHGRIIVLDPSNKEAHYSMGVLAWALFYPEWTATRAGAGMKPEDPGPIPDATARLALKQRSESTIAEGIGHLRRALEIDNAYDDAMAYLNLLLRESADLSETGEACRQLTAEADGWLQKALTIRKARALAGGGAPAIDLRAAPAPTRIEIGSDAQKARLISQVAPVYPQDAKLAGIQGTVRFSVVIGTSGAVQKIDLVSGPIQLVPAAQEAVRQWKYHPTLLNGQPVEVRTIIDVNFAIMR
ncbi:MAG: TonB family protein [Bryobacterales bacterium]|nr:TonB family protein [Bryobacterales bacterium]